MVIDVNSKELIENIWRHEFKYPEWCRREFQHVLGDKVVKLSIPVYYSGSLRRLCIELFNSKIITYSSEKLGELLHEIARNTKTLTKPSVEEVLRLIFKTLLNNYHMELTEIDNTIENTIHKIMRGEASYKQIYKLYNKCSKIHRGVHGAIFGLELLENKYPDLRDLLNEAIMLENMYSTSIDRITQAFNLYYTVISEKTNRVVTKLTVISAIFLPLTLIAGIYGMNFKYMPELQHPLAYPLVLIIMAGIALGELLYFKKKKWI